MMLLRNLIDDRDTAVAILNRWEHDADLSPLDNFRISANAVYPYTFGGETRILRFAPDSEKPRSLYEDELDFLEYLRGEGFPVAKILPSRAGNRIETVSSPRGGMHACSFSRVPGKRLDGVELTPAVARSWGELLGRLHRLATAYAPEVTTRPAWHDRLAAARDFLRGREGEAMALRVVERVWRVMSTLPRGEGFYGFVHGDFERDNLFLDGDALWAIDFDDLHIHWYAYDAMIALEDMEERRAELEPSFLEGYRARWPLDDIWLEQFGLFRVYHACVRYADLLRILSEDPATPGEPAFMAPVRSRLSDALREARAVLLEAQLF